MTERRERAVICADGRVHYGPEYLHNDDPERVRACADAHIGQPWCGGGPHKTATRKIITTAWKGDGGMTDGGSPPVIRHVPDGDGGYLCECPDNECCPEDR